jgi:hypothetical protein
MRQEIPASIAQFIRAIQQAFAHLVQSRVALTDSVNLLDLSQIGP